MEPAENGSGLPQRGLPQNDLLMLDAVVGILTQM